MASLRSAKAPAASDAAPATARLVTVAPVMESILANWYWHYFQQNRWRFMQRTATAEAISDDFTTWDLSRILGAIDKQFTMALSHEAVLKKIPIAEYDDLLAKGTAPDAFRPTLFDFVAHDALRFYSAGEQAGAKTQDAFDLSADSPIFASPEEFLKWEIETTDTNSPTVKAIRLYQNLIKFHAKDEDKSAFLDADLARLVFGFNKANGEEKNARYKAALKKFTDKWGDHRIAARALHHWATVLQQEGKLVEAHKLATRGANAFPNTPGGNRCYNLIQNIEAKSSNVTTERVWNEPQPKIRVNYRNVTKIYFRAVSYDWEQLIKRKAYRPEYLDSNERQKLLAREPALKWSAGLPATDDYQQRTEDLTAPKDLKAGFYFLIASHDEKFSDKNNIVTFTDFWVSDLAIVTRTRYGQGQLGGFVLNAISGEPIPGATVKCWYRGSNNQRISVPSVKTDKNGLFSISAADRRGYVMLASHQGQQLATQQDYWVYKHNNTPRPYERTVFFTDRSLYRPGQTIHYKGVSYRVFQPKDEYKTITGRDLTVIFSDPNGKEISKTKHRTNDYGSFAGSFTAPRDRLMGRMSIRVEGEPRGQCGFNVEEYKRPKFEVKLEAPKTAAKLNDTVSLTGRGTAYTGVAIGGAKVRWRVVRQVRYPGWWYWRCWWRPPNTSSQEIAHGRTMTGADGAFEISFLAKPDLSVAEEDEPRFVYTIYADVTDTTGETRSAQRGITVGYTALQANMSAPSWLTDEAPVALSISTATLDGEGQQAEGSLKIYRLKEPTKVQRQQFSHFRPVPRRVNGELQSPQPDLSNPNSWELGDVAFERGFTTDVGGNVSYSIELKPGAYRAMLETQDRFGKKVTAMLPLMVMDPEAKRFPVRIPNHVAAPTWTLEPGDTLKALWGTGYDKGRAFIEIEHRNKVIESYWTDASRTQASIEQEVTESMRGGFTVRVTQVRENRAYLRSQRVNVPWSNKNLSVAWEHFVSKLGPGVKETWTAVVTGPDAKKAVAEMVAGLYDESLDAYLPHNWQRAFGVFRHDSSNLSMNFENVVKGLQHIHGSWPRSHRNGSLSYRSYPHEVIANLWGYQYYGKRKMSARNGAVPMDRATASEDDAPMEMAAAKSPATGNRRANKKADAKTSETQAATQGQAADKSGGGSGPDLSKVKARTNLNETAFFFPHLISDEDGKVKMEFTMPEALTRWKFQAFAHDNDLRAGFLTDTAVTAKDLMVQPNPPRFLREGDVLEFTVKVANQSAARQKGTVRLTLADARTGKTVDVDLGNATIDQEFDIASKESRSFSWKLAVPDDMGFLTYKTVAATNKLSDGEEGYLPVLSKRVLVTESIPLPIRGPKTKKFVFDKLKKSGDSNTLKHKTLTVQMVSNPSWYAVMALPYLMEYPHQCSEQTFNRLYANSLARHIAKSDPKIRRVFDQWKGTPALDSPMEKNQDLKAVMLEETPWLRQAKKESEARRNVGILFDENRLNDETARAFKQLAEMQQADGLWPWFPGLKGNRYITLYITTGFGRLRHLGTDIDPRLAIKAVTALDVWIDEKYDWIVKHGHKDRDNLSTTIALYLYGRSFFLDDKPIADQHKEAVDYFLGQARKHWLGLANRQSQAHLSIALKRFGDLESAKGIMRSIKERSVTDEELGMFWRDTELSWWWYRAPIETQAMMIEGFDEVMGDAEAVEECKVWLLKQKQTQDWKTTKATADAIYGLLLRGTDLLASDALVEVSLADVAIKPENVEVGTGFYEKRFVGPEIKPEQGDVTVKKTDEGVAWGSVHWQYLEDMSKVTPHTATPLTLEKQLFIKEYTNKGPVLKKVDGPIAVGDELVVRIVLRTDRDMEYVHMKDYRGSGTEPVNVLSRSKYQDGLRYYESTRDTASHFFMDYLPKGVYVFEYSVRVQHKGRYQTGYANIQCMYAPEFNSHSESIWLEVK